MSKRIATNMASEFYIASVLWRLGFDVTITLGHTKEIDIIAKRKDGKLITIDVKAVRNPPFLLQKNEELFKKKNHFLIFVYYGDKFSKIDENPRIFIVPSTELSKVVRSITNPKFSNRWETKPSYLKDYENRWDLILKNDNSDYKIKES